MAIVILVLLTPAIGHTQTIKLRGIAVDQNLDDPPLTASLPAGVPAIVRLTIDAASLATAAGRPAALTQLEQRLDIYASRNTQVVLELGGMPSSDGDVEPWRAFLQTIAERSRGRVAGYQIGRIQNGANADVTRYVYLLKLAALQLRSVNSDALVLQGSVPVTDGDWQERVFAGGVAPYIDGLAFEMPADADEGLSRPALLRMTALAEREKPSGTILLGAIHLPADPTAARSTLVDAVLRSIGTNVTVTAFTGVGTAVSAAFVAAARLADLITADLVTLDERTSELHIVRGSSDVTQNVAHRLLFNVTSLGTFLVYVAPPNAGRLDLEIAIANATSPMVRDPVEGTSQPVNIRDRGPGNRLRLTLPMADHPLVIDFNVGNSGFTTSVEVQKEPLLRIGEIISRYQQAQAAQDAILRNYVAHVRIEQHFHPSPADPPYNLVTENRLFSDKSAVEWEELSFELNGAKWTANRPAFPLVQPEKVLSLPLDLRLSQDYAYRLDGADTVGGRVAYVVRFDPVDRTHALYRGTVWIDQKTFVRLKVQAVETQFSGPIVSNEETQLYERSGDIGDHPIWLLRHLSSKQVFLIAGRTVLIEREVQLSNLMLNPDDFERQRNAARASDQIMYRDTSAGIRYLVKQGDTRVVSDRMTTSSKAFVLGADIDPSFDRPLPIGGLNILDFNFLNHNLQLALLFGGVIGLGNIQHANLWGGRFDASIDFFALALKANDDVFDGSGKRSGERVDRIPLGTGLNIGYQATSYQKIIGRYELKYDAFFRDVLTSAAFVIPTSTTTNGEGASYEYRRRGYSLLANYTAYQRSTWAAWGDGSGFNATARTYTKYDLGLSKDFTFATFHTIHFAATYFGGERLDRFSEYQFGLFDATRMHGVPSAVRFGELGMFRGSYSFNVFDQYRLDLFFDHAGGRDPQTDNIWRQVTGTGIRLNQRTPWSTILQVDFGKSFLPDIYRGAGSTVLQIMLLKPL